MLSNLGFLKNLNRIKRKQFRRVAFRSRYTKYNKKRTTLAPTPTIMPSSGGVVLRAVSFGIVRQAELISMHKVIRRKLDRRGSLLVYSFPFVSLTAKPLAVRMGKGKGVISDWIIPCVPGKIIFRVFGVTEEIGRSALRTAARKLNFETVVNSFVGRYVEKSFNRYYYNAYKRFIFGVLLRDFHFYYLTTASLQYYTSLQKFKRQNYSKFSTLFQKKI